MARIDPAEIYEVHARVCKAIANPKRLLIINMLRDGPRSVGEIALALGISQPNTSQHLAILRERGILTASRSGSTSYYSLRNPKVLAAVDLLRESISKDLAARGPVAQRGLAAISHPPMNPRSGLDISRELRQGPVTPATSQLLTRERSA